MYTLLSRIIAQWGAIIYFPAKFLPLWGQLLYAVFISTLIALGIYKLVSSPQRITHTKNLIKGAILEMRLFRDNARVMVLAFLKAIFQTGKYFLLNIFPVIVIFPLLLPLLAQLDTRLSNRPLKVGEIFLVELKLSKSLQDCQVELMPSKYYRPLINPVNVFSRNEVNWKLQALQVGRSDLKVKVNGRVYSKEICIEQEGIISAHKFQPDLYNHRLYPLQGNLATILSNFFFRFVPLFYPVSGVFPADGDVLALSIDYPIRNFCFLFLCWHWMLSYLVLVIILALILKKRFGVDF